MVEENLQHGLRLKVASRLAEEHDPPTAAQRHRPSASLLAP
jgi:hypothetical protein